MIRYYTGASSKIHQKRQFFYETPPDVKSISVAWYPEMSLNRYVYGFRMTIACHKNHGAETGSVKSMEIDCA